MQKGYFKTSDGAYLYYEDQGQGEDTIVFVPGHMCTTKFFEKNTVALSGKHRVVTIDSRGFGNSSKPLHGNNIERHADDIAELIAALNLKNVILMGWSLSGSVVVTFAHKYQSRELKGLGLIDCCLFPFSSEEWNSYNSRDSNMDDWNEKYRLWYINPETYIENFVSRMRGDISEEEIEMVKCEIRKTPPWIGFALHSDWCHSDCVSLLSNIGVPVIIFSGTSAGHNPSMGSFYQTKVTFYSEHHEFTRGGHMLFFAQSEKFNRLTEEFIQKIS